MKLRHLQSHLQELQGFKSPKVHLEQYVTQPHIAACMLHTADSNYEDISGKIVADLGCGCGVLSVGSALMGCAFCYAVDIDEDALDISAANCEEFEINNIDVLRTNVSCMPRILTRTVDTVIMNPPFGTKGNLGADIGFLEVASQIAETAVYSLHKTSTRAYVLKKAKEFGLEGEVIAELRYDLPATYRFHKKKCKDIAVDFFRFSVRC